MLAAAVIFSPFFLLFAESCLKINFSTPPKCECKFLALDSPNMQQNIGTSAFYPNISLHPVHSPIISIDDCALTAYCNENYDLVGFDPLEATMFGKYNAEGFCDPYTQKWLIDTGDGNGLTTYSQFFGICVDYSKQATTPVPQSGCTNCSAFNIYNSYGTEDSFNFAAARYFINGCVEEQLLCVRVDDIICETIGIMAKTDSGTYQIEESILSVSGKSAGATLACGSNGMHSHGDIIDIKEVSCSYEMCS